MLRRSRISGVLALLLILASSLPSAAPAAAQAQDTATMTVLRGQVAVIRPDGSAVQPAPSGTAVRAGDEIRTLSATGALITFFAGTEIELGEQTIMVVEQVTRQGERVDVSLKQVFGTSLSRVQTFTDPTSSYRIEAGGAVALVRGTEFVMLGPTREGIVILVCLADCDDRTTFAGTPLSPFTGYYVEVEQGRVVSGVQTFRPDFTGGPWNAASEGATTAAQAIQGETRGVPPGQVPSGQREEIRADMEREERERKEDKEDGQPPAPPTGGGLPCGTTRTVTGGGLRTETRHDLGRTSGTFRFEFDALTLPDRFQIFYEGREIEDTGFVPRPDDPDSGRGSRTVPFGPGPSTSVTVVVTGSEPGTAWDYTVECPNGGASRVRRRGTEAR
jgi:hypothetical protein